ncbi:hypothetical protein [Undibacterium sp. Ji49W]|uniref:hypothetical protein n=1 Tax=Undibacterium sp. Ji49W TaxID=3413040 RepID=UPI003BF4155C
MRNTKNVLPRLMGMLTNFKAGTSRRVIDGLATEPFNGSGTVLSISIQNLGTLASTMPPAELVEFLSEKQYATIDLIAKSNGLIAGHVGAEVLAYWQNLDSASAHSEIKLAFSTALNIMKLYSPPVSVRIALSFGGIFGDFYGPQRQFQLRGFAVEYSRKLMLHSKEKFSNQAHLFLLSEKVVTLLKIDESAMQLTPHIFGTDEVFELIGF